MFKEKNFEEDKIKESIIRDVLGDREDLEKRIRAAMIEAEKGGGYEIGTNSFKRYIIGSRELTPNDFGICANEIMKVVSEIRNKKKARKIKSESEIVQKDPATLAAEVELEEEKRTGVPPEEFNKM